MQQRHRPDRSTCAITAAILSLLASGARAQVLSANDDAFGDPVGLVLTVKGFGVLENDVLDGDEANPIGLGRLGTGHRFLGVIDAGLSGFTRFEFREIEGRVGNARCRWADDITFLTTTAPIAVPALSVPAALALIVLLAAGRFANAHRRAEASATPRTRAGKGAR